MRVKEVGEGGGGGVGVEGRARRCRGGVCVRETSVCTRADVVAMYGCVRAEEGA